MPDCMSRADRCRQQYSFRRYLKDVPEAKLAERLSDVIGNMLYVSKDGAVRQIPPNSSQDFWLDKYLHVLEEYRIRGIQAPSDSSILSQLTRKYIPAKYKQTLSAIRNKSIKPGSIVKYMQGEHADKFYKHGELLIRHASYYNRPEHNPAVFDKELQTVTFLPRSEVHINLRPTDYSGKQQKINTATDVELCTKSSSDYYVSCFSSALDLRLFFDFGYNACVIIQDTEAFSELLGNVMLTALNDWQCVRSGVNYYDPFGGDLNTKHDPFFSKDFKYAYQNEVRFIWLPPECTPPPLCEITAILGSLEAIAECIWL